jgi:hypothetical protein
MSRTHLLAAAALALTSGLAGHALRGERALPSAEARASAAGAPQASDLQWEFCAVVKAQYIGTPQGGTYWIVYFRDEGVRTEDVRASPTGNAFAKAVARLGQEGWDMVGSGPLEVRPGLPGGTPSAVFFKRRRERE